MFNAEQSVQKPYIHKQQKWTEQVVFLCICAYLIIISKRGYHCEWVDMGEVQGRASGRDWREGKEKGKDDLIYFG